MELILLTGILLSILTNIAVIYKKNKEIEVLSEQHMQIEKVLLGEVKTNKDLYGLGNRVFKLWIDFENTLYRLHELETKLEDIKESAKNASKKHYIKNRETILKKAKEKKLGIKKNSKKS